MFKMVHLYRGVIFIMLAELCFTASTVFSKLLTGMSDISALEVTFARFILGLAFASAVVYKSGVSLAPNKLSLLVWRGVLNTIAVILFFLAAQYTTITNTHMLNMTYPFFIFLFAPVFFRREKVSPFLYPLLIIAVAGIWLVINPHFDTLTRGDLFALLSAVAAALAIITLNMARKNDSTVLILFYLMLIGTVVNGLAMLPVFVWPEGSRQWLLLLASGSVGVLGQACITYGYKYITARSGSLVSTSRILYAVALGMMVFGEALTWRVAAGGLLIMISIAAVTRLNKPKEEG
ncbi:MAG: DMT family transporter [Smithellaceae bacterium]|jgi:drug/metabolite transporter (DMT)-like permease|nr:DMT family transporter [Syntrophaceae bacterium]MDD4242448.1 DMT family transporter [Smithellaceae bacterium]NLX52080.1 DMT family transporter [Deltaproteobacteria bacterium]